MVSISASVKFSKSAAAGCCSGSSWSFGANTKRLRALENSVQALSSNWQEIGRVPTYCDLKSCQSPESLASSRLWCHTYSQTPSINPLIEGSFTTSLGSSYLSAKDFGM